MSKPPPVKHLSIADLEELMRVALGNAGWSQEEIQEHIDQHKRCGWLRPNGAPWARSAAGVHYALRDPSGFPRPQGDATKSPNH